MTTAIAAVAAVSPEMSAELQASTETPHIGGSFLRVMERELTEVNNDVATAELAMQDLAAGKPVELHDVMIGLERARLSVQTFVQVRNKLVESYQDLMRMQM